MVFVSTRARTRLSAGCLALAAAAVLAAAPALAQGKTYDGKAVRIGHGTAHTVVVTDAAGHATAIGIVFTAGVLDGLPHATKTKDDFPYRLAMPRQGPRTAVNHVVMDWEANGHPPPHVYDVPHFDFHFYLVSRAAQMKVKFKSENDSGSPAQQPPAELVPAGYVMPPGTAVPQMGAHAVNPAGPEFHGQPFTATFIYGYYDKQLTFLEPMVSIAYLKSQPDFAAAVARPAAYSFPGADPSAYSVKYDAAHKTYTLMLEALAPAAKVVGR
ncbi:MAG: DUF5602 domain-containing protein [Alphaproteobacteria bacterium]|nr:DUF5602 domain-containing protein [Alphaproteobacteria bacterium]